MCYVKDNVAGYTETYYEGLSFDAATKQSYKNIQERFLHKSSLIGSKLLSGCILI